MFDGALIPRIRRFCRVFLTSPFSEPIRETDEDWTASQQQLRELKRSVRSIVNSLGENAPYAISHSDDIEESLGTLLEKLSIVEARTSELEQIYHRAQHHLDDRMKDPEEEAEVLGLPNTSWLKPLGASIETPPVESRTPSAGKGFAKQHLRRRLRARELMGEKTPHLVKRSQDNEITISFNNPFLERVAIRQLRGGRTPEDVARKLELPIEVIKELESRLWEEKLADSTPAVEAAEVLEKAASLESGSVSAALSVADAEDSSSVESAPEVQFHREQVLI